MSIEYVLALPALPPLARFAPALVKYGGVDGDWQSIRVGSVHADAVALEPEVLERVRAALRQARLASLPVASLVIITGIFDDVLAVAAALMDVDGGALISDEGEVIEHRRAGRSAPAPAPVVSAIDVTIPVEVEVFAASQIPYALAARRDPTVKFPALVKQLTPPPAMIGQSKYGGHWDHNVIGDLVIKRFIGQDCSYYAKELRAIGVPAPDALFRLNFEHWHVKAVPEADWRAALQVMCGLARATAGILYRTRRKAAYDFAPAGCP
ncbi:MAG: hypothetical protein H6Q90_5860 [Deltaproteobacteria bacterium]|nr:hypothetical protein [Deltaproteobacteria bacterium]